MSVNKAIILGRLGKDPEIRFMPNGDAVANFSVATGEKWVDQQGNTQERTEWHNLVLFRRLAEVAGEYLKKGSQIYVEGKLQTRKWQAQDGQDRYTTEIVVNKLEMIGGKDQSSSGQAKAENQYQNYQNGAAPQQQQNHNSGAGSFDDFDDDIPF